MAIGQDNVPDASAGTNDHTPQRPETLIRGRRQLSVGDAFPVQILGRLVPSRLVPSPRDEGREDDKGELIPLFRSGRA
jgi:hypothetical protein